MSDILSGKSIIVTGAGGGIGTFAAQVLGKAGARLILSDVNADAGNAAAESIVEFGGEAVFVSADLTSDNDTAGLTAAAIDRYGRLDGAFNNAGVEQRNKPLLDLSIEEWNRAISINLTAVFMSMKHQIKAMIATGGGAIVNTASTAGVAALPNVAEYCASKHGVVGLTRAAAVDYARSGIRVNAVLPGPIKTPMIERLLQQESFAAMAAQMMPSIPLGRFGEPSEVGEAVAWLLSDGASNVTGTTLAVDGGFLAV